MIIHNPILTGSFTYNGIDLSSVTSSTSNISSLNAITASILLTTGSLNTASGSAITRLSSIEIVTGSNITRLSSLEAKTGSYATTGSNTFIGTQTISGSVLQSGSFTSTGTLTAQTLVVQTITSSVDFVTGSTRFGSLAANTHIFTGSMDVSGSITSNVVSGNGSFYINNASLTNKNWTLVPNTSGSETDLMFFYTGTGASNKFTITSTGAATFVGSVMANGLATSVNYKLGTTGAAFIAGSNNKGIFITDNASYASIVGLNSAISAYNPIELRASGTDYQLYLATNGNVGILTTTPQTPLQILRDTTGNGTNIEETNMAFTVLSAAGQSKISIGASNEGNYGYIQVMQDATSWTSRNLTLQPRGGNVGIGTYSPTREMVLYRSSGEVHFKLANGITGQGQADGFDMAIDSAGAGYFIQRETQPIIFYTSAAERMSISSGGNVLIGSGTTAQGPLDVFRSVSGGLGGHIILRNNGAAVGNEMAVMFVDGDSSVTRAAISSTTEDNPYFGNIKFKTGLSAYGSLNTRMTITGAGRVGIGTTGPDENLHVTNTGSDTVMKLGGGGAARDTNFSIFSQSAGNTVTAIHYNGQMAFYSGKFTIQSSGAASLVGALTQNTSDIRLKTNIAVIENAINKIKQLSGFTYNWNSLANELGGFDTTIKEIGVAAQSVKEVAPEAVFPAPFDNGFNPSTQLYYSKSGENYLTVQYEKLVPLLIEGIKELNTKFEEYKATHP